MSQRVLLEQQRTESIIGAFFRVYRILGYGFLAHIYAAAMERELRARGHTVAREMCIRIMYEGEEIATQRLDMIVDEKIVVELKSTAKLHDSASRQVFNYLKATNLRVGLLFHFGPKPAFWRIVGDVARSNPEPPELPEHPCPPSSQEPAGAAFVMTRSTHF